MRSRCCSPARSSTPRQPTGGSASACPPTRSRCRSPCSRRWRRGCRWRPLPSATCANVGGGEPTLPVREGGCSASRGAAPAAPRSRRSPARPVQAKRRRCRCRTTNLAPLAAPRTADGRRDRGPRASLPPRRPRRARQLEMALTHRTRLAVRQARRPCRGRRSRWPAGHPPARSRRGRCGAG